MKPLPKTARICVIVCALGLASITATVSAQTVDSKNSMQLRAVMEQLGHDMQAITGAISNEDWHLVAELAPKIANHAQPSAAEKGMIITWLGADAGKFRGFDGQVEVAANNLQKAAMLGDGEAVIDAFAKTQQNCLACHQSFRKPFIKQFYPNR